MFKSIKWISLSIVSVYFFVVSLQAAVIIDTFDAATGTSVSAVGFDGAGSMRHLQNSVTGPIGGLRTVSVRDAHSGALGGSVHGVVNTSAGSLTMWGSTTPHAVVSYGTALDALVTALNPWDTTPGTTSGTALGLSLSMADSFEYDVIGGSSGLTIHLYNGSTSVAYYTFGTSSTGLNSALLSDFTGISSADLSSIDGIGINQHLTTTPLEIGEFRFATAAVPEPTTMALMGLGLGGLALARRKRSLL